MIALLLAAALAAQPAFAAEVARVVGLPGKFEVSNVPLGVVPIVGGAPRSEPVTSLDQAAPEPFQMTVVVAADDGNANRFETEGQLRALLQARGEEERPGVRDGVRVYEAPDGAHHGLMYGEPFLKSLQGSTALRSLKEMERALFGDGRVGKDWFHVWTQRTPAEAVAMARTLARSPNVDRVIVERDVARLIANENRAEKRAAKRAAP
jgi:hypothetical protein